MLELRPTCENCNKALPPNSLEARICTYECTFCVSCVDSVLGNVCPNCGGGFAPRPIRPSRNWKGDNFLGEDPASTKIKRKPVDPIAHAKFSAPIKNIPPEKRQARLCSRWLTLCCCRRSASVVTQQLRPPAKRDVSWLQNLIAFSKGDTECSQEVAIVVQSGMRSRAKSTGSNIATATPVERFMARSLAPAPSPPPKGSP